MKKHQVGTVVAWISALVYLALLVFVTASQNNAGFGPFQPNSNAPKAGRIVFAALLQLVFAVWCTSAVFRLLDVAGIDLRKVLSWPESPRAVDLSSVSLSRRVAYMATALTWFLTCGMVVYLALFSYRDPASHTAPAPPVVMQFALFFPMIVVFFLPRPLSLFRERLRVLRILGESLVCVVGWPVFGRVDYFHVLITDALTSATLWLFELEFSVCHFATTPWTNFTVAGSDSMVTRDYCGSGSRNNLYAKPLLYTLPFWLRFVQCVFQFVEAHRKGHTGWARNQCLVNAAKYLSAIAVVVSSTMVKGGETSTSSLIWIGCLIVKTVYCYAWDIFMDWGLLGVRPDGTYGLRAQRFYPTFVYALVAIFNLFGRVSWSLAISPKFCEAPCALSLGILEVARRAVWAVLRTEWQVIKTSGAGVAINTGPAGAGVREPLLHGTRHASKLGAATSINDHSDA